MIILSVGMPRAGSGWSYNLTNDLMLVSGAQDARQIRQRYHLQTILTEVNCNIGALTPRRLLAVLVPSLLGNTFVIKAHAGPTPLARRFIHSGLMRTTYIYRDPRDAMLSAVEYGQRARQRGHDNAFARLVDFESALGFMEDYVRISEAWLADQDVLHTRYENLLTDFDIEAARLAAFLGLDRKSQAVREVFDRHRPESAQREGKGRHFSKGKIGRFRREWDEGQQQVMAERFGAYLEKMDYEM